MRHDNSESFYNDWEQDCEVDEWILYKTFNLQVTLRYAKVAVSHTQEELSLIHDTLGGSVRTPDWPSSSIAEERAHMDA